MKIIVKCAECDGEFTSKKALKMHYLSKHPEKVRKPLVDSKLKVKIRYRVIGMIAILLIVSLGYLLFSNIKTFPPTDSQGHVERTLQN